MNEQVASRFTRFRRRWPLPRILAFAVVGGVIAAPFALILALWVAQSHMEASAFNRITGKNVSTWDAMWLELRVQEPAK